MPVTLSDNWIQRNIQKGYGYNANGGTGTTPITFATADVLRLSFEVPIVGWTATQGGTT